MPKSGLELCRSLLLLIAVLRTGEMFAGTYTIRDLGTLPTPASSTAKTYAIDMNAAGQIIGTRYVTTTRQPIYATVSSAYRTGTDGVINASTNLGSFGFAVNYARAINSSGQVVGEADASTAGASTESHAYRTTPTGSINASADLHGSGLGRSSAALGINDIGQTVGYFELSTGNFHAFRIGPTDKIGVASDLGTLAENIPNSPNRRSIALAINNPGQCVGYSEIAGGSATHAFFCAADGTLSAANDMGTFGGSASYAYDINDSGWIVGGAYTTNDRHAFRTTGLMALTAAADLGSLGRDAYANSINSTGQTVGSSKLALVTSPAHAFFVDTSGPMIDLNTLIPSGSGWVLNAANKITDDGRIVGEGTLGGQTRAFLLTPVPEPCSLMAFAFAGIALLRRTRSKSRA